MSKCIGYGEYEGKCNNKAGTKWGPLWCMRCDKIRMATISSKFKDITNSFKTKQGDK